MNIPVKQLSSLDHYPMRWIIPCQGRRYRNRVSLTRSNEDGHKLSDREFLDPDHNRAHPFDILSACESKSLEEGVMRGEYDISVS